MIDTSLMLKVGVYRYEDGDAKSTAVLVREQYVLVPKIKNNLPHYDGVYTEESINVSDVYTKVNFVDVPPSTGIWHYIVSYSWAVNRPPLSTTSYNIYLGILDYSIFVKEVEIEAG
jgi:hypothetical protein